MKRSRIFFFDQMTKYMDLMSDLGSNVNILLQKSWETMEKFKLACSPIQLQMEDQYNIFPIGRLEDIEVDLAILERIVDFEVIKVMDEMGLYITLFEIDWAFDNYVVIYLKKESMTFEANGTKVAQPLDRY